MLKAQGLIMKDYQKRRGVRGLFRGEAPFNDIPLGIRVAVASN